MTEIVLGEEYLLEGNSEYFKEKYGTCAPVARVDMEMKIPENELGIGSVKDWFLWIQENNYEIGFCASLYWHRFKKENLPLFGTFYYAHIQNHGELIHKNEIDRI